MNNKLIEPTQMKGLNRNSIDKYYTKEKIVELCLNYVKEYIQIENNDLVIEPSAGNGSFIDGIKTITPNYRFYDLEPENNEIIKQDYLMGNYTDFTGQFSNIHIIGNPPFGRQSSTAIQFIKKSCEFCNSISFILPKSFKKDSLKQKIPLEFHLIFEIDLPNKSFLVDGNEYNVPCIFQIWKKQSDYRTLNKKIEPFGFIFVKKNEEPDISVIRVGGRSGAIDTKTNDKNIQSHYFIKFTNNKLVDENIKRLSVIKYLSDNTVGPKSISKPELIEQFNPLL